MRLGTFFNRSPLVGVGTSKYNTHGGIVSQFGVAVKTTSFDRIKNGSLVDAAGDFLQGGYVTTQLGTFSTTFRNYIYNCDNLEKYSALRGLSKSADEAGFAKASEYFMAQQMLERLRNIGFIVEKMYGELEIVTQGARGGAAYGTDGTFLITQGKKTYLYPLQITTCIKEHPSIYSLQQKIYEKLENTKSAILTMTSADGVGGRKSNKEVHGMEVYGANIAFVVRTQNTAKMISECLVDLMAHDTSYGKLRISFTILVANQPTSTSFMYFEEHCKTRRPRSMSTSQRQKQPRRPRSMSTSQRQKQPRRKPRCHSV